MWIYQRRGRFGAKSKGVVGRLRVVVGGECYSFTLKAWVDIVVQIFIDITYNYVEMDRLMIDKLPTFFKTKTGIIYIKVV